jgi:hypothetical protein
MAAMCSAVNLRDGAGTAACGGPSTTADNAPNGPWKGAPVGVLCGVHVGARAEQRCDDRAFVSDRRTHQRRHSTSAQGGAGGGGEPPIRGTLARVTTAHTRSRLYRRGPGGQRPEKTILTRPLKRFWKVRAYSAYRPPPTKQSATMASVKRRS